MTYVKNNWSIRVIQNLSSYKAYTYKFPNLSHFLVLNSIIYIFLHKEKQMLKLEKWALKTLKIILVGYYNNSHYMILIDIIRSSC